LFNFVCRTTKWWVWVGIPVDAQCRLNKQNTAKIPMKLFPFLNQVPIFKTTKLGIGYSFCAAEERNHFGIVGIVEGWEMEKEEDQFYDTREELCSVSDGGSDCSESDESSSGNNGHVTRYQVWTKNLESVHQRRLNFLRWMGLDSDLNYSVVEDERSSELDILDNDPSNIYFKINNFSCVTPLDVDKEKLGKTEKLKRSSDATCVIVPPKTFRISAKPLHEFQGHSGDILDLAWSKRGFLLSSSVDKTVRLWHVGIDRCLRVFSHNNYVTCINFNPVNDNFFISGSIDGKVRIWEVLHCRVSDYIDIREIVTAVCFSPDGKGTIVGTMAGNCRFYDILDNHLQLDAQLNLGGKKKTSGKKITGFEFSPSDPSKLLVASADSQVCILSGVDVIYKFKGLRNAGQMHASFTTDGKHVVSVSEDSNVCIWNYTGQDRSTSKAKKIWSSESFVSHNAAIAVPWCGIESMPGRTLLSPSLGEDMNHKCSLSSPDCFFLSRGFLSELIPKVSATWPEETLVDSCQTLVSPTMCKSEYKFLRSACKGMSNSHLWGQVIVTAGWDGYIRVYQNYGL
ncbi:SPAC3H5.08c, partial [Mucuna pruriens]